MSKMALEARPILSSAIRNYRQIYPTLSRYYWGFKVVMRYGRPRMLIRFPGGLGDHLLLTTVFRELRRRGYRRLWMMSNTPELFFHNADIDAVVPEDQRFEKLTTKLGGTILCPMYTQHPAGDTDRDIPPPRHIISYMCLLAGVIGRVALRPYFTLLAPEREAGQLVSNQITIQSSGMSAQCPMLNKDWYLDRFQQVVSSLKHKYNFVQVGTASDPPLRDVIDMRGRSSVRQTAAILSQSIVFVGLIGFLMHLARSVECRSVIIYGGRESPHQSGYSCNINLFSELPCSPCWRRNSCPYDRECMKNISARAVIDALESQAKSFGQPLPIDWDTIPK